MVSKAGLAHLHLHGYFLPLPPVTEVFLSGLPESLLGPRVYVLIKLSSVKFSSVAQSCPTLRNPMNRSTPGLPVHHHFRESTQPHVHGVGDTIIILVFKVEQ